MSYNITCTNRQQRVELKKKNQHDKNSVWILMASSFLYRPLPAQFSTADLRVDAVAPDSPELDMLVRRTAAQASGTAQYLVSVRIRRHDFKIYIE